jgi:hypothetical protein
MTNPDQDRDTTRERLCEFEFAVPSPRLRERIDALRTPGTPWGALSLAAAVLLFTSLGETCLIAPRVTRLAPQPRPPVRTLPEFDTPSSRLLALVPTGRGSDTRTGSAALSPLLTGRR